VVNDTGNPNDGSLNGGNGEVIITYTVGAASTGSTTATTSTAAAAAATPAGTALAVTGADLTPVLVVGGAFVAGGTLILSATAMARRKKLMATS
jgi:hypothetical protein